MITSEIEKEFKQLLKNDGEIDFIRPVSGGDINEAFAIEINNKIHFLKVNERAVFPTMFQKEAHGLHELRKSKSLQVPDVFQVLEGNQHQFLILDWLTQSNNPNSDNWYQAGFDLAQMHLKTQETYGFKEWNYIGSIRQENNEKTTWAEFFATQRIEPIYQQAREKGYFSAGTTSLIHKLLDKVDNLFPIEQPALLHGDLWNGNMMFNTNNEASIYDPAVYFGHREMDIAMTKLFGGFDDAFYLGYNACYPLEKGWEERLQLGQLYPLLIHVLLFGGGYVGQVERILNRFN